MSYYRFIRSSDSKIKDYECKGLELLTASNHTEILPIRTAAGVLIPLSVIELFGWNKQLVPDQTTARIEYEKYLYFYTYATELESKVYALKAVYDDLGADYDMKGPAIEDKIIAKYPGDQMAKWTEIQQDIDDKAEDLATTLTEVYHKYLKQVEKDDDANPVGSWSLYKEFPKLIQWLPGTYTEEDIPPYKEPEIVHE